VQDARWHDPDMLVCASESSGRFSKCRRWAGTTRIFQDCKTSSSIGSALRTSHVQLSQVLKVQAVGWHGPRPTGPSTARYPLSSPTTGLGLRGFTTGPRGVKGLGGSTLAPPPLPPGVSANATGVRISINGGIERRAGGGSIRSGKAGRAGAMGGAGASIVTIGGGEWVLGGGGGAAGVVVAGGLGDPPKAQNQ
jgi:hypothetical protein